MTRSVAVIVGFALVGVAGATDELDDGLAAVKRGAETVAAEVAKLRTTNAALTEQTATLKSQLALATTNLSAFQVAHRALAARVDRTTVALGGTAPPPNANIGAGLVASFDAMERQRDVVLAKLAEPPKPIGPDIHTARLLRIILPTDATPAELDEAKAKATAWLGMQGFDAHLREQQQAVAPLEPAIDTGQLDGWGVVEFSLAPAEGSAPYADPWQGLKTALTPRLIAIEAK